MNEKRWIKLSKWGKINGLTYRTAHRHFKAGLIPHETKELPSGALLVCVEDVSVFTDLDCIIYGRVSSHNKKDDLKRQIERCTEYAIKNGFNVVKTYKEIASGMNDNRREFNKVINEMDNKKFTLIVENKDRLTRFGFNFLDKYFNAMKCKILVINKENDDQTDLIKDLVSVITSFCCRLYGMRRGAVKARDIKNNIMKSDS